MSAFTKPAVVEVALDVSKQGIWGQVFDMGSIAVNEVKLNAADIAHGIHFDIEVQGQLIQIEDGVIGYRIKSWDGFIRSCVDEGKAISGWVGIVLVLGEGV